jgi:6-phosphogluconolactonase
VATFLYVSCAGDNSILAFRCTPENGLEPVQRADIPNVRGTGIATPMAVSPDRRFLFVAFRGAPPSVSTFGIDQADGRLRYVGNAGLAANPAYLTLDAEGRHLFGASYADSRLTCNPIAPDGRVHAATQSLATDPKAHCVRVSPDGTHLWVTSLGGGHVLSFAWNAKEGIIAERPAAVFVAASGAGPRHLDFHKDSGCVFVINELDGTVDVFRADHGPAPIQTVGLLESRGTGRLAAADLHLTPNGRFLYGSERTASVLTCFSVDPATGRLDRLHETGTERQPRSFAITPDGRTLVAAGTETGHLAVYAIDRDTGRLTLEERIPVGENPNWIEIVALPR